MLKMGYHFKLKMLLLIPIIIPTSACFSSRVNRTKGQTTCRCTPVTNCLDGTGGIDPRILNNPTQVACIVGERFCCNLINPNLGSGGTGTGTGTPVQCGIRRPVTVPNYVPVAGQADFAEYPWLSMIYTTNNTFIGAGALIDNQFVISVAHKFVPAVYNSFKVRLGEWILNVETEPLRSIEVAVVSVRIHEGYQFISATSTLLNDIAILRLATPVDFTSQSHINSACLPAATAVFTGQTCWVAGYGTNAFVNGVFATTLREVDLPIVDGNTCQNSLRTTRLGPAFTLNQQQFICAGGQAGKDTCNGDGGAPLVCLTGTQWYIAALTSWGVSCGDPLPGVYVNVANYIPWITANRI